MLTVNELRDKWQDDCRLMIPEFELLDDDRMHDEIDRVREFCGLKGCSDLEVVVYVLRNLDEERGTVPAPWWWITASLLILEDMGAHPWFEVTWWLYHQSRGQRALNTLWGSASCGKTEVFAAMALTNLVVWHGDAHVYVSSPYKNSGSDKIWRALAERRVGIWSEKPPHWAKRLGLKFAYNKASLEITVTDKTGATSTASFISLETAAPIQGRKRQQVVGQTGFDPMRGIMLLIGDELILNPAACEKFMAGEGNLIANNNVMSWTGCNPMPHQVKHANAIEFSAPVEVSIDSLMEHKDFAWRTNRGTLLRFCMANSPNRFARKPVFDYLINEEQAEAATKRGETNYAAQVAGWGWGQGMGNGGVLTLDAVNTPAWQPPPVWATPPHRWAFFDLAFGGSDPAGYICLEAGSALVEGKQVQIVSGVEQEKLHVERMWKPTREEVAEFADLAKQRGGVAPDLAPGVEVGANAHMVMQVLRVAKRLGIPRGRVSFDSSMRPDVTLMMIQALGTVPYFYSGSRPLKEEESQWSLYPPVTKPDGTATAWSDCHTQVISAAWRFAEHVIVRGNVHGLNRLKKGTQELLGRLWVQRTSSRVDVEGKRSLKTSPMWGETLALGLMYGVRFCGALPHLANEKPLVDGAGMLTEHPAFAIRSRKLARMWA